MTTRDPAGDESLTVGLVYDLRDDYLALGFTEEETAEFDRVDTIDAIDEALRSLGHRTTRVGNVNRLLEALLAGERWDLVFNIAEGLYGLGREALVPAVLDHFRIPYTFSDPMTSALTLDKATAKRVVRDAGVPTADFAVVTRADQEIGLALPVFLKPIAEGTGKGIDAGSVVRSTGELRDRVAFLLRHFRQPVLAEAFLPGRELTVCIAGTGEDAEVLGTLEVELRPEAENAVYSYVNKERCEELVDYRAARSEDPVVAMAERHALAAWRVLGCRDGGRIDMRCDAAGQPVFLECNPLSGLHPHHSDLPILCSKVGIGYTELIARIVASAVHRLELVEVPT